MASYDTRDSKLPTVITIIMSFIIVAVVSTVGIYASLIVIMLAGGWMWTKPASWGYAVSALILVASFVLCVYSITATYRIVARMYGVDTNTRPVPVYIYIIAILTPILLPTLAYFTYIYSTYYADAPETCLVNGLTYLKETDKCKQLDNSSYIEPDPLESEEFEYEQ